MSDAGWHLDKRVPIGIIAALIVQSATVVWWARGLEERSLENEKRILKVVEMVESNRQFQIDQRVRVWDRVEDLKTAQQDMNARIKALEAITGNTNQMVSRLLELELQKRR